MKLTKQSWQFRRRKIQPTLFEVLQKYVDNSEKKRNNVYEKEAHKYFTKDEIEGNL